MPDSLHDKVVALERFEPLLKDSRVAVEPYPNGRFYLAADVLALLDQPSDGITVTLTREEAERLKVLSRECFNIAAEPGLTGEDRRVWKADEELLDRLATAALDQPEEKARCGGSGKNLCRCRPGMDGNGVYHDYDCPAYFGHTGCPDCTGKHPDPPEEGQ